jgi:hypothetical protein
MRFHPDVMVHAYNLTTQLRLGDDYEFQGSLGYIPRHCLKKTKEVPTTYLATFICEMEILFFFFFFFLLHGGLNSGPHAC